MCKMYANTIPSYMRGLHICGFGTYGGGSWNTPLIKKDNCIAHSILINGDKKHPELSYFTHLPLISLHAFSRKL
jgi:hypothetical protein